MLHCLFHAANSILPCDTCQDESAENHQQQIRLYACHLPMQLI
jgi:hypothetical protein